MVERQAPLDVAVLCERVDGLVGAVVGKQCWHVTLQTSNHRGVAAGSCAYSLLFESSNDALPSNWQEDPASHGPSHAQYKGTLLA